MSLAFAFVRGPFLVARGRLVSAGCATVVLLAGLDHIRWLGGGSGAGKTTVARGLAERYGASIYSADATIRVHSAKLGPTAAPLLAAFRRMNMDERWVQRDPWEMYRTFPWFQGEGFDLVIEDLRSLPTNTITIAEGFRLLPRLVRPLLSRPSNALWLIPTPEFRRTVFAERDPSEQFWRRTTDPELALANLLRRDELFSETIATDATRNGLTCIPVTGGLTTEAMLAAVAGRFCL